MPQEKNICTDKDCPNKGQYCRIHIKLKASKPEPIAKKSKKREVLDRTKYAPKATAFKKANPECQAMIEGCTKVTQHVHHMKGRNNEADLLDEKYWLAVCFNCHNLIEANPEWAKQNGFSKSRHSDSKLSSINKKDKAA